MFIIIFLILFFILNIWHIYTNYLTEEEKKSLKIWYDTVKTNIIRRFIPEYNEILYNIYINQGFVCNCWTNELIRAYKNSDESGKKGLISFHKLVYHNQ